MNERTTRAMNNEDENWMEKCMSCAHCYIRKDDADTLYCRCRNGCHYKEYKPKNGGKRNERRP